MDFRTALSHHANGVESLSPGLRACELPWDTGPRNYPALKAL